MNKEEIKNKEILKSIEMLEHTRYEVIGYLSDSYMLNVIVDIIDDYKECLAEYDALQQENEKLNHYKLLYQKVKEKNEKAVAYIENRYDPEQKALTNTFDKDNVGELLELLEGNNEIQ